MITQPQRELKSTDEGRHMINRIVSRLFAILLLLFPLISNYNVFVITPSLLYSLTCFLLAILWLLNGNRLKIDLRGFPCLIYILFSAAISIVRFGDYTLYTLGMRLLLYFCIFMVFYVFYWQIIDLEFTFKWYIRISLAATAIVIFQFLMDKMGKGFCLVIPGIPVTGLEDMTTDEIINNQMTLHRYSSLFFEPAHQAQFVLPCIALVLFGKKGGESKKILLAVFMTIGLFCTTSSIGIIGAGLIWGYYFFSTMLTGKKQKIFGLLFLIPLITGGIIFLLSKPELTAYLIERLEILKMSGDISMTGYRRMVYGWQCFDRLSTVQKILGVGYKNAGAFLAQSGIGLRLMNTNDPGTLSYMNGIAGMLVSIGAVGTILNLRLFFFEALKTRDHRVYALLLTWAAIMFTSNAFDDPGNMNVLVFLMCLVFRNGKRRIRYAVDLTFGGARESRDILRGLAGDDYLL